MTRDQKIKAARAEYEKVTGAALAVRTPSDARVSASE
jgi:hypothetical protein